MENTFNLNPFKVDDDDDHEGLDDDVFLSCLKSNFKKIKNRVQKKISFI